LLAVWFAMMRGRKSQFPLFALAHLGNLTRKDEKINGKT